MLSLKYKNQIIGGIVAALLVWGIFLIADAVDEFVLKTGTLIGAIVFILMPLIMLFFYISYYIKYKTNTKKIIVWFINYYISFLVLWLVIYNLVSADNFFIMQHRRTDIIDLNGIEYMLYGFSTLIFFTILCILFHCILGIIKRINNKKGLSKKSTITKK